MNDLQRHGRNSNPNSPEGQLANAAASPEQLTRDLFDYGAGPYPTSVGFARSSDTSREAANEITHFAKGMRGRIARRFYDIHPRAETSDEIAAAFNCSILSVRPRFSELSNAGLIEKTNERRPATSLGPARVGKPGNFMAAAWRATPLLMSAAPSIAPGNGIDGGPR